MALTITHNIASLTAQDNLTNTNKALNQSLERLSSGLKINRGADGPAALVISELQRAQIVGLQTAIDNTSKAVNVVQTGEGALNEINALLDKVRGLALDSANSGVNDQNALNANQAEIGNALSTITGIATSTQYGSKKLLDGSAGVTASTDQAAAHFQSAADTTQAGTYTVAYSGAQATRAEVVSTTDISGGLAAAQNLSINGVQVSLSVGDKTADVISKINAVSNQSGVFAAADTTTSGAVDLLANQFGSAGKISVTSTSTDQTGLVGTAVTAGTDLVAGSFTITDAADTAASVTPTVTVSGNTATIASGAGKGLTLSFDADQTNVDATLVPASTNVNVTNGSLVFQIGANANQTVTVGFSSAKAIDIGKGVTNASNFQSLNDINVTTSQGAQDSIAVIDQAINDITGLRGKLGAFQSNTLEGTANNLRTTLENTTAAESTIRDTDFAAETASFTKNQVLLQAGTQVLANANQTSQLVLGLLK
jgi:flagellin